MAPLLQNFSKPWQVGVVLFAFVWLIVGSGEVQARFLPDFDEIQNPSMRMVMQSMRAHQIQWNLFLLYTLNVDTPGYIETGGYGASKGGVIETVPFYRWRAGPVVETSNPLDFYLDASSRGFFQVLLPTGLGYTRDGRFTMTLNRKLVMVAGGYPVLGERGEIYLPPGNEVAVSNTGMIYVDGSPIDRMKVVLFTDKGLESLDTLNGSIFYLTKADAEVDTQTPFQVRQGFIEQNNVLKALIGDVTMASRTYEATSKAGRSITKMMNSVIQLGNP